MLDLLTSMDSTRLGFYKSILEEAGIACFIRNENTALLTNMLAQVLQPTLCVLNEEDHDEAVALLRPHHHPAPASGDEWQCQGCQETSPAEFELCWNCQKPRHEEP